MAQGGGEMNRIERLGIILIVIGSVAHIAPHSLEVNSLFILIPGILFFFFGGENK
jgi:hypothetical protein